MLGPNKWILFTIVGGVLLSIHIHAIDAPAKSLINPEIQSYTNQKLGLTIENLKNVPISSRRHSRNLVPPYQQFSKVDGVQFIDSRTRNSRNLPGTFGSFRIEIPRSPSLPSPIIAAANFKRRSDEYDDTIGTFPASQQSYDVNYDFDDDNITTTFGLLPTNYNQYQNKMIPISIVQLTNVLPEGQNESTQTTTTERNSAEEKDESKISEINSAETLSLSSSSSSSSSSSAVMKESDERSSRMHDKLESEDNSDKVRFPESNEELLPQPEALTATARRSGIRFEQNNDNNNDMKQQQQTFNPFVPQSYSEESLNFGDTIPHFQRPYTEETIESNENERVSIGNRYYRPFIQPFRDDVTKFGDHSGPITAFNRPIRDFIDTTMINFPRTQFESATGGYFESPQRPPRHYFPSKVYTEYAPDFASPKYLQPSYSWKSRQPRVVFPAPNDFAQGTVGTTYVGNDNIVFR
jgi:hypothetical protein